MLALEEGKTVNKKYFWMRTALKHKNKIVQSPVFRSGTELMDDYRGTAGMKATPLDKLLMCCSLFVKYFLGWLAKITN